MKKEKCRVGMTTNLMERKQHWQNKHPDLWGWEIFGPYNYREDAQEKENELAKKYNCVSHQGGRDPYEIFPWYVYMFYFGSS